MRLTDTEKRLARGIFDAMYPSDPEARVSTGIASGDIEGFLDDVGDSWEAIAFVTLRAGFVAVALSSVWINRTLRPYATLPREARLKVLTTLYSSDNYFVRQLVTMQKAVAGFLYGAMIRPAIAPGRAPVVDESFVAWRKLVPAHRANANGAEHEHTTTTTNSAADARVEAA
jgi:hypothetical protein